MIVFVNNPRTAILAAALFGLLAGLPKLVSVVIPLETLKEGGTGVLARATLTGTAAADPTYLGFDRNDYPGDATLPILRKTFAYTGYWLNNPPGGTRNSWTGKRPALRAAGFGFLVLFNGRTYAQINRANPTSLGKSDADAAVRSAQHEGFPARTIIFLDQEEGGRLLPQQRAYLHAWIDGVTAAGFRAGVYCSGIGAKESGGNTVVTAEDILQNLGGRKLAYWVANDACPPSPGCTFPGKPPSPAASGVAFADVWQFAESPRRPDFAASCRNYNRDQNCYPPAVSPAQGLHVDVDTARSADPSAGRTE